MSEGGKEAIRARQGLPRINHKCVRHLMLLDGVLLQRYTEKLPTRVHDGKVITLKPNMRWTSDGFEIPCWSGGAVRVAFALDTCDCKVMAWQASTGGLTGEMIRDLMVESIERRFGDGPLPHHKALRMRSPREFIRSSQPAACPVEGETPAGFRCPLWMV